MEILVIGGSRFVGPLVVEKLLQKKHKITLFNRGNHKFNFESVKVISGDRNNGFRISKKFDVVVDMCAYNGKHTATALEQLKFDFFVHMSTAAAYKKTEIFPLTEESPLGAWPVWGEYNKGKVECEQVLASSNKKYATVRPVYILGPNNYCDREHFIYSRIKAGSEILVPGDGQAKVQFVFAKDVAESIAKIIEKQTTGAFNCACSKIITLNGLVEEMGKIVGKTPKIKLMPEHDGVNFSKTEFPFANETFVCSNEKLKRLGVKFTPLVKGLEEDYRTHYSKL